MPASSEKLNIAIAGATGAVGEVLLELLTERAFPVGEVHLLASERSAGETLSVAGRRVTVRRLDEFDFAGVDFAFFSAGGSVSAEHAPRAAAAGATVIDNTSHFRMQPEIPLVVPEVNGDVLADWWAREPRGGIIANPNCSTIQMLLAIAPIQREFGITRINVATYQAVSGAGRRAMEELGRQTADKLNFRAPKVEALSAEIAFNVIPRIDVVEDSGYTREELKMHNETRKIFADESIAVNATAVRVPVFHGHSEAVHLETARDFELDRVRELLDAAAGIERIEGERDPMPLVDASGSDITYVGRIRRDFSHPRGLDLWVVSDNLRKGAALNAIQIAELLIERRAPAIQSA
ncbi:MAG: aspartate-semialdehyde dehydrogenase [Wenzhouxiangellaceae bacterium]|nr:aspartate-semialdehyde dehydrogenase [Wenzhouxiangellaceae bacterium]